FNIDKNAILLESAVDFTIRRWLSATPTKTAIVEIIIQKPNIYITSDERNFDVPVTQNNLKTAFHTFLVKDGYSVAQSPEDADCILNIKARTMQKSFGNGIYTAALNVQITLSKKGKIIYNRNLGEIKGVQLTPKQAGLEAYKEAVRQVEVRLYRELQEALYK
ncbi:MAG TPA: hypothetical protein PLR63_04845, partial [Paludibacteraceae bacterium]|nr:hypothetical protein [Paludibacteraceae bacterium]